MVFIPDKSGIINWKVRAFNPLGYGLWSISDSIRYSRLPHTPLATHFLNLTDCINITTDTVTISWTEVQHAETYKLQVLSADSQFNHDTILAEKSHTLSNLKDGYLYSLRVRSINKRGKSPWSSPLLIKVAFPLSSVSNENGIPIFSI